MAVPTIEYISQMNPSRPAGDEPRSEGDDWLREVQRGCQGSFPNLGSLAVTPTAEKLNALVDLVVNQTVETRLSNLENVNKVIGAPADARDFDDVWWTTEDPTETGFYVIGPLSDASYVNVPWQWDFSGGGTPYNSLCLVEKITNTETPLVAMDRITRLITSGGNTGNMWQYTRGTQNRADILAARWVSPFVAVMNPNGLGEMVAAMAPFCDGVAYCG